jgi:hypothetical protein
MSMAQKTKPKFGKPEEKNPLKTMMVWGFIALGVGGIIWMIATNPSQRPLNCTSSPTSSLGGFGSCTTD